MPLVFAVEPDPYFCDGYIASLMLAAQGDSDMVIGQWSRFTGWEEMGTTMGSALAGYGGSPETMAAKDVVVPLLELAERLESGLVAVRVGETSPFERCILRMRGLEDDLDRGIVRDALYSVAKLMRRWGGTMIVELREAPAKTDWLPMLGPITVIEAPPVARYGSHARTFLSTIPAGVALPMEEEVVAAMAGLVQVDIDGVLKLAQAWLAAGNRGGPIDCLKAARRALGREMVA